MVASIFSRAPLPRLMSYAGSGPDESSCGGEVRERISANDRDLAAAGSKVNQDQTALLARNLHGEAGLRGVDGLGLKEARKASERKSEEGGEEEAVHMPGSVTPHAKSRARVLLGWGAGLFVSHIVSGYMQELLFAVRGYTFGFYLTLGRYLVNALLAYLYLLLFDGSKLDTPAISIHNLLARMRWLSGKLATDGLAGVVSTVGTWQFLQRWARRWDRYMGIPKRKTDQFEEHDEAREEERSADEDLEHSADGPQSDLSGDNIVGKEKVAQPGVTAISIEEEVTTARSAASGRVPIKYYLLLSFLSVMALGLSTSSLAYLNYPTKVLHHIERKWVILGLIASLHLHSGHSEDIKASCYHGKHSTRKGAMSSRVQPLICLFAANSFSADSSSVKSIRTLNMLWRWRWCLVSFSLRSVTTKLRPTWKLRLLRTSKKRTRTLSSGRRPRACSFYFCRSSSSRSTSIFRRRSLSAMSGHRQPRWCSTTPCSARWSHLPYCSSTASSFRLGTLPCSIPRLTTTSSVSPSSLLVVSSYQTFTRLITKSLKL